MRISLLVPVYGVEKYIGKCAMSLFRQTYRDIEYIFVDDSTKDASMELLERILADFPERKPHVKMIRHEVNRGLSAARNTALENASGDYVMHVDSDDWLQPRAVELFAAKAAAEDADIVVADIRVVYPRYAVIKKDDVGHSKKDYIERLLMRKSLVGVCGKMFRRKLFLESGVRFVEGVSYGEDYAVSPRAAYFANKIVKLDETLYNYVRYNAGAITSCISGKSMDDILRAVDVLAGFFAGVPDAADYRDVIPAMKLRNKIDLIKVSGTQLRKVATGLWPEVDFRKYALPCVDKMVLRLAAKGRWRLLNIFVSWGYGLKRLLRMK